ncbi:MAG: carboxypeptidase regulatory-like domain-containing protein [Archangiaceae bacterium]|nr:carboxypeptidase regulatory-like domain-containing protein [Archangiaceae bacterium]
MRRSFIIAGTVAALLGAAVAFWPRGDGRDAADASPEVEKVPDFQAVDVTAQSQEGLTLSGVVKDPSGNPVRDATVSLAAGGQASITSLECGDCRRQLLSCPARESGLKVQSLIAAKRGELSPALTTTSDEHGRFRFEHLSGVSFTLWASAAGFGEGVKERAAPGDPVELFLPPLRALAGKLTDSAGRPVNGRVYAVSRRVARYYQAQADDQGFFELKGLGEGPFYLLAEAPGKLPAVRPQVQAGPELVNLTLLDPRTLEVSLTHDGKPIDGTVSVSADHVKREAPTKAALAKFLGLYPDRVVVTARAGELSAAPQMVSLDPAVTHVTLELEKGGTIAVNVLDESGDAVPQPTVTLLAASGEKVLEKQAAAAETVTFGPIGPGEYKLEGSAPGFLKGVIPVTVGTSQTSVVLTLNKGTTIAGRVLDEYGRAAPGVSVLISPTGDSVLSDPGGAFLARVPSPGLYALHAHHSDWGGGQKQVTAPAAGVELQLEPRAGVAVTVLASGRRVEGANAVMFIDREGNFRNDRPSGADGVVLMRGLPAGTYTLLAAHPDYLPSERQTVVVSESQLLQVTAELKDGASVLGQVVDQVGAPVPGVAIGVVPRGAEPVVSDAQGRFELKPLRPKGAYSVKVNQRGFDQVNRVLAVGGGPEVKVVVHRQPVFRGRVVSEGRPVKHFRVDDHEVDSADGRFELPLPATEERVIFSVESPGYEPLMADRPVSPDLGDLELKKAPSFAGFVHDEGGAPVPDAVVGCEQCEQSTLSGPDGRFTLSNPPFLKSFTVTARKGRRSASREVSSGGGGNIDLTLKAGTQLTGGAWLADGRPASGVEIQGIGTDSAEPVSVVTGADGSYTLELPAGTYRFALSQARLKPNEAQAIIARVQSDSSHLDFGPAPGTSSVTVRVAPQRGYALWLVRGAVPGVGNPPLELLRSEYAQLVYQPTEPQVTFRGLRPGPYTLVWASFHAESTGGPLVVPIDVPSSQTEVSLVR